MKIIVTISRIFVGVLFILSGLIKLNDPVGFSFKLEEY
ncbi:MAG: DoxX family protein, partial [Eudoraea sp.]|nr:DoxX family protein [Eudoraea sp.]